MLGIFSCFKFIVNISNSREIDAVHEEYQQKLRDQEAFHRKQIQRQQLYVEDLKQQILRGQIKAEQELENDQALINQQIQESRYPPPALSHFLSITEFFHPLYILWCCFFFVLVMLCVMGGSLFLQLITSFFLLLPFPWEQLSSFD